jgi:hypothetical protein
VQRFSAAIASMRFHEVEILSEILALKARPHSPRVVRFKIFEFLYLAGEKAAAQRTVRNEGNTQLAAKSEQSILGFAAP